MTRIDAINRAIDNLAHRGSANEQASGPILAEIIRTALAKNLRDALDEEAEHAVKTGKKPLDHRAVCLGVMKNMRHTMQVFRDELDGIDSVGIYK